MRKVTEYTPLPVCNPSLSPEKNQHTSQQEALKTILLALSENCQELQWKEIATQENFEQKALCHLKEKFPFMCKIVQEELDLIENEKNSTKSLVV